jgi:hypothetical protein
VIIDEVGHEIWQNASPAKIPWLGFYSEAKSRNIVFARGNNFASRWPTAALTPTFSRKRERE